LIGLVDLRGRGGTAVEEEEEEAKNDFDWLDWLDALSDKLEEWPSDGVTEEDCFDKARSLSRWLVDALELCSVLSLAAGVADDDEAGGDDDEKTSESESF
jgi:hypothetical protein